MYALVRYRTGITNSIPVYDEAVAQLFTALKIVVEKADAVVGHSVTKAAVEELVLKHKKQEQKNRLRRLMSELALAEEKLARIRSDISYLKQRMVQSG